MPIKQIPGGVTAAQGFTASGVHCGIRKNKSKRDLALIVSDRPASAAAVYTQLTDVEGELNGLITYDRRLVKIAPEAVARMVRMPPLKK